MARLRPGRLRRVRQSAQRLPQRCPVRNTGPVHRSVGQRLAHQQLVDRPYPDEPGRRRSRGVYWTRGTHRGGRKSHATTILLALGGSDVLSMIREQKHLLHHRSHCRYRHRPQSARPVLAEGLPRLATSNFIRYSWELGKSLNCCGSRRITSLSQFCFHETQAPLLICWLCGSAERSGRVK
jgi:hypothetical protein